MKTKLGIYICFGLRNFFCARIIVIAFSQNQKNASCQDSFHTIQTSQLLQFQTFLIILAFHDDFPTVLMILAFSNNTMRAKRKFFELLHFDTATCEHTTKLKYTYQHSIMIFPPFLIILAFSDKNKRRKRNFLTYYISLLQHVNR